MKRIMAMALLSALATASFAAERVYKWVDENGVTHFSSTPPPEGAERVRIRPAPVAQSSADTPSADGATGDRPPLPEGELYAESEQPDNSAVERENARRQCERGRNMIAQIEPRPRVFRVEEDGSRTYLEDDERMALLDEARALVAEHCDR